MKTLLLFLLTCTATFAQDFLVTPAGLLSKQDDTKNYFVASFDGVPADTLYNHANKYIQDTYNNGAASVMESNDKGTLISFVSNDTFISKSKRNKNTEEVTYYATFTTTTEFKDNRVKITYTKIEIYYTDTNNEKHVLLFPSFWDDKGKLLEPQAKKIVENHFNAFTRLLIRAIKKGNYKPSTSW